jgi:hypothetical protein
MAPSVETRAPEQMAIQAATEFTLLTATQLLQTTLMMTPDLFALPRLMILNSIPT